MSNIFSLLVMQPQCVARPVDYRGLFKLSAILGPGGGSELNKTLVAGILSIRAYEGVPTGGGWISLRARGAEPTTPLKRRRRSRHLSPRTGVLLVVATTTIDSLGSRDSLATLIRMGK